MQGVKQILVETVQSRKILTRAASIEEFSGLLTALSGAVSVISDKGLWVAAQKQREIGRVERSRLSFLCYPATVTSLPRGHNEHNRNPRHNTNKHQPNLSPPLLCSSQ